MNRQVLTLVAAVCSAVCLYSLGEDPGLPSIETETIAQTTAMANSEVNDAPLAVAAPIEEPQAAGQETEQGSQEFVFNPPFPDRTKLFQAPKRQGGSRVNSHDPSESSVELLGFVNVNGPRVALSINGLVTTVAEGDTQQGVEVISIQPPAVVLQRGRQRWQASFEN